MAKIDLEAITEPIGDEQPCGPDLDAAFDNDFMNFFAEIEGVIPTRYFSFDPGSLNFETYYDQIGDFLERTRDIRILVPLAKLKILQSDLAGFADTLSAIHRLLKERWSDVHPQPGDFLELSMGQLSTLDDMPNVVLPLQHVPLVRSRRAGSVTLRKWQIAQGEVNPREGEEATDAATLSAALAEADTEEIARVRETLTRARDAVAGIRLVCIEEAGFDEAPSFERLPAALEAALSMIETAIGAEPEAADAGAAEGEAGEPGSGAVVVRLPTGAVASREAAVEAMFAAARYFALKEPSSPVPILLREAQSASAKSFYELVNDLVPDTAANAFVSLGTEPWFDVSLYTLDARNPAPDYEQEETGESAWEDAGIEDDAGGNDEPADGDADTASGEGDGDTAETVEAAEEATAADGAEDETADDADVSADDAMPEEPSGEVPAADGTPAGDAAAPAQGRKFVANSRPEAVALLEKVLAYYRVAEPTSPVPLLVERAIDMSSRSFVDLLGKVLPEGSLKVRKTEEGENW